MPEQFPLVEPEHPEQPQEERYEWRIVPRPVKEAAPKKEMVVYEEAKRLVFEPPVPVPVYEEFDAAKSFADLKAEMAAMKTVEDLSVAERRGRIRARLGEIRERLARQEQGIAETIRTLQDAIGKNPNEDSRELFRRVAELAPKYHFSNDELREFWDAITHYRFMRNRVEHYRNAYPDDRKLFNACFGRMPNGRVEVEQRPASLYFHCYNNDDYLLAYAFGEIGGDENRLTKEMAARAAASGGAALRTVDVAELGEAVAIERSGAIIKQKSIEIIDHTPILGPEEVERFAIADLAGPAAVEVPGAGTIIIEIDTGGGTEKPPRISIEKEKNGKRQALRGIIRVPGSGRLSPGGLLDEHMREAAMVSEDVKGPKGVEVKITCTYSHIRITNTGNEPIAVAYRARGEKAILDEARSAEIREHEEQHIMNRFFVPLTEAARENEAIADVARTAKSVAEGRRALMESLARIKRSALGIDNKARDEILAFYKDGTPPAKILRYLARSPLYDYRNRSSYKKEIDDLPKVIAEKMTEEMSMVLYAVGGEEGKKEAGAARLLTDAAEVEPCVARVFGKDYRRDVGRWLHAIEALEQKGYGREEIVSMLYGERVTDWQAFARRAPEKKKEG